MYIQCDLIYRLIQPLINPKGGRSRGPGLFDFWLRFGAGTGHRGHELSSKTWANQGRARLGCRRTRPRGRQSAFAKASARQGRTHGVRRNCRTMQCARCFPRGCGKRRPGRARSPRQHRSTGSNQYTVAATWQPLWKTAGGEKFKMADLAILNIGGGPGRSWSPAAKGLSRRSGWRGGGGGKPL